MENDKRFRVALALAFAAMAAVTLLSYGSLPERMAIHWGFEGEPNGYAGKLFGALSIPVISLFVAALLLFLPRLDPLHGIDRFRKDYNNFVLGIIGFLLYMQLLVIAANTGFSFDFGQLLAPGFGALFFIIGGVFEKSKRNWFAGIRTPWTLSSDAVWEKTHVLGAKMFKASGVIAFLGILLPGAALWLLIIPVIASAICLVVYSYLEYAKEQKREK